jgi:tRNA threonylcarbamoyladenosine biosynthesis protein TsaE
MMQEGKNLELSSKSLNDLPEIATQILTFAEGLKIWIFEGEMGVGKTTLIKQLCHQLDVMDTITSPTYSIINEYKTNNGGQINHFDFYRIKNEREAIDIGCDEYFHSGDICLIEWPSMIPGLIPEEHMLVNIWEENFERKIQVIRNEKQGN